MILSKSMSIPDGVEPESFVRVSEPNVQEVEGKEQIAVALQAFQVFVKIATALGVPVEVRGDVEEEEGVVGYEEWMGAGKRAISRQQSRNN